jgi:hypothetical protein
MLIKNSELLQIAEQVYRVVYPTIEQDRMLTTDQIRQAIKERPDLPQVKSERYLNIILNHICEM